MRNPIKRWKLSPMDIESRRHWVDYSKAKDVMFAYTDTGRAPWYVVNADDKKRARLNCIAHLLQQVPYQDMVPVEVELPPPQSNDGYKTQDVEPTLCARNLLIESWLCGGLERLTFTARGELQASRGTTSRRLGSIAQRLLPSVRTSTSGAIALIAACSATRLLWSECRFPSEPA